MKPRPEGVDSTVPVIATDDIEKSIAYYTSVLGFEFDFKYGEPIVYAGVKSGSAEIYFAHSPDLASIIRKKKLNPEVYIWVPDADSLFRKHTDKGAEIAEPIADRPWYARQYTVKEINGYHLKFAQPL